MRCSERFREEGFGCFGIPGGTEQKFQGIALRIHGAIEIHPHFFHLHVCLIYPPRIGGRLQMRSASFVEFRGIALHPAVDRGVVNAQSTLDHHLLKVAVAQRIAKIPAHAQQNDLGFEVKPFEWMLLAHEGTSSAFLNPAELTIASVFLQQNPFICASCNPTEWMIGDIEVAGRWNDYFELPQYLGERLSDLLVFIETLLPF